MNDDWGKRAEDQTAMAKVGHAARVSSRTFWAWAEHHHLDALAVLVITLTLSIKVMDWAMTYAYVDAQGASGAEQAAIIAAVLGPWGLAQAAMFKFYVELKAKNGKVTP